jgi:NAD(P)-dependent dehydrogenase (short-subunit alcohol dehydrogenase family)
MGTGMVKNLTAKGHTVRIWNRTESKAEELARSLKIDHAKTLKDLATSASVLMLCVTNTSDVEQVVNEAAASLKKNSLVIDWRSPPDSARKALASSTPLSLAAVKEPRKARWPSWPEEPKKTLTAPSRFSKLLARASPTWARQAKDRSRSF